MFVVDREAGELRILARRTFRERSPRVLPLKSLSVRVIAYVTTQLGTRRRCGYPTEHQEVRVEGPEGSIDVLRGLTAPVGENWGRRLAEDLGCEMTRDARNVW